MDRTQCPKCFAIGAHFYDCEDALPAGLGIGTRMKRSKFDEARWTKNKAYARNRDQECRFEGCEARRNLHPHHIETVQECEARGVGWAETDRVGNIAMLCHRHHDIVHSAAGLEDAIAQRLRIRPKNYQESPSE